MIQKFNDFITEKWKDEVEIKQTGEHADKTVAELKSEISILKNKNKKYIDEDKKVPEKNKEQMGELLFALRAKQGWKKHIK